MVVISILGTGGYLVVYVFIIILYFLYFILFLGLFGDILRILAYCIIEMILHSLVKMIEKASH